MNSNQRANKTAIEKYRKELMAMVKDIQGIDKRILDKAVNVGLADVKQNTPVVTSYMKRNWYTTPTRKGKNGVEKKLINIMDYSSYVNYGRRIVVKGVTVGFVKGKFMLEKAVAKVDKVIESEFKKSIERVNKKHGK